MEEKQLLFVPKKKGILENNPFSTLGMATKAFALCSQFLLHQLQKKSATELADEYIKIFWRQQFESAHATLYATGREYLAQDETYLFMSNHESWMDIPAIFGAVPTKLRMVSKLGLMQIPIIGKAMAKAGFIAIDRRNRIKAISQLNFAKKRLAEGISVWIAPEGTRSRDGTIARFKKGGFYLARDLKKAIVPVFIEGAAQVMPADSLIVHPNKNITVHFLPPIAYKDYESLHVIELVDKVRNSIINKQIECRAYAKSRGES